MNGLDMAKYEVSLLLAEAGFQGVLLGVGAGV